MTKFPNKLKKPCFWPILDPFSQFWGKKNFLSENSTLSRRTLYEFLAPCQISEKMIQFQENIWTEGWMEGWKTDRPYFIGSFQVLSGVQKLSDIKTYRWTQNQRKNLKNQHCLLSILVPQIEYLYYPLNAEGVIQKGPSLPGYIR